MTRDSTVTCTTCDRKMLVTFAHCLRKGWPKCCGYTMRLTSHPSPELIGGAVADAFAPLHALRDEGVSR